MGVLHYIADAHLRSPIRCRWHLLLLLYVHMCGCSATTLVPGVNGGYTTTTTTMRPCVISTVQSCQCNSIGLYCASLMPRLREVPPIGDKHIRHLDLTDNAIEKIKNVSFLGLEFLESLCLGKNSIDFIHPDAFKNLYRLEILNLEGNILGNLDPSGHTFQHLSSLKFLYLQNNGITTVNKYSFLTMAASSTHVTVNLEGNPIVCGCDVWALKQWRQTSTTGNRTTISLYCNSGGSYMEVPESTFGSCNDSTDAVFSDQTSCPVCVHESTNNRCQRKGSCQRSLMSQAVCYKTVAWNSSSNTMELSSRCEQYDICMQMEANNNNTCGLDVQSNKSVVCSFCCKGPTCDRHSIGGRTRDFTFYLSFYLSVPDIGILNIINSTISEQIASAYKGIEGGIDGNMYAYVQQGSTLYRLVLQVHLTTFNTMSENQISWALRSESDNLTRVILLTSDPSPVTVTTYFEGLECQIPNDTCPSNMLCTASRDGNTRCLCDSSSFYNSADKTCSPLTKLQVANIRVSSATTDKICLNWTAQKYGHIVTYTVQVTPDVGKSLNSSITDTGASFSGLHTGTEYNFTVTSMLNASFYDRLTETLLAGVWTKTTHGGACDLEASENGNLCAGDNIECMTSPDGRNHCLCSSDYYYCTSSYICRKLNELQVKNITASSSIDTVILRFMADKRGTNVTYEVALSPHKGFLMGNTVNESIAHWSGLDPGSMYNFTVISILPATTLYMAKNVSSEVISVWTTPENRFLPPCPKAYIVRAGGWSNCVGKHTKTTHGGACDLEASENGNLCTGDNIECMASPDGRNHCLCSLDYYYCTTSNICRNINELQVKNITASSSIDTVILRFMADKCGTNVTYEVALSPHKGFLMGNTVNESIAHWSGLDPGSMYNFTVISILPATTLYMAKNVSSEVISVWTTPENRFLPPCPKAYIVRAGGWNNCVGKHTKAVHGGRCDVNVTNGRVCMGAHISCTHKYGGQDFCLCSPGYYFNGSNICEDVNELQVRNLNAILITSDTVILRWTADKRGRNVEYRIDAQPLMGQEVLNSIDMHGGNWTGLNSETQYNFSVTSVLPKDDFYSEMTVTSQVISIWTKGLRNVTINISYIKQDEFLPFMSNRSSPEYLKEEKRITTGVTAVLVKDVDIIYVHLLQFDFRQISSQQYKVDLVVQLTTYDAATIGQVLNHVVQIDTQDINGFFYKENFTSLDMGVNDTQIIRFMCPFSVTSLDRGGIKWNESYMGTHYSPCPFSNPLDDFTPIAERKCFVQNDGDVFPVWGEVNTTQCITKEQSKTPNIFEVFERNITIGNAEIASVYLRMITNNSSNLSVETIHKSMESLEILTTGEMLQLPNVATNVINCVNNLLNVNINTLQQSQMLSNVSSRLLDVIDSVANKAPLDKGKLQISTVNLAVAARKVDSSETMDITLINAANGNDENVTIEWGDNSQLSSSNSLMIPMEALVDSLDRQQKQNLSRISFIVHRSDTLFSVISLNGGELHDDDDNDNHGHNNELDEARKNESYVTQINSRVLSASVPGLSVNNLKRNITMNFEHKIIDASKARCVFWDKKLSHGKGDWSEAGCGVVDSDSNSTTCGCNHLTNFALLMDVYDQGSKLSALDRKILSIISYVGCGISCFALLITLITYSAFKKLRRDNPAKILINLCLALLCTNLVFLLGMQDYSFQNTVSCKAVAVLLHYFLLASLSWMAVEAFYMYLALIVVFKTYYTNFILKCSVVGWGVPLLVIIITLAVNATDNYGFINSGLCWLKNPAFYAAFVGPVCFILLINCIAFILVVKQLASMSSVRLHKTERNSTIQRLRGAVGVVILLGLAWIFAIFAIDQASVAFYYLFAIFNSLQGLFIFIFYCLLKSDAVLALKRSLPCFEEYGDSTKSYSNSKGATNTAAGHHLMEHKSGSSKKNDHSKGTLSTTLDSRKDSCFSTLSGSNTVDDKDGDGLISNPSIISHLKATSRLLQSSHDTSEDTSSTISTNSDKPIRYFSDTKEANPERGDITTADSPTEVQDTSFCQPPSEAGGGSVYSRVSASTHDPQPKGSTSRRSQAESPENSPPSLKHGRQTDEAQHPSVRADGEIDCSHLASVHDILHRFEHNIPLTDIDNNVITAPEEPSEDYEDDTPSYKPTNSDSPTRHLKAIRYFPDAKNTLTEAETERLTLADIDNNLITSPEEPSQDYEGDTPSYMPTNYDSPTRHLKAIQHFPDAKNMLTEAEIERQDSSFCEHSYSLVTGDDDTPDIPMPYTDDPLPTPSCLRRSPMPNLSSLQMKPPENDFSYSLDPTHHTDEETLCPSFTPFRADGEIDYSHLESVSDVQQKFEWLMSENSDKNVTKI